MVFKRRDRRSYKTILKEMVWPRGGWARAFYYVRHRLHRLPDTPEKIARGVFAGIVVVFSPFFGMHFPLAALLALAVRGNVLAAMLATFVGNPVTFVPIGMISLGFGRFLLGMFGYDIHHQIDGGHQGVAGKFLAAANDLRSNFLALFSDRVTDWHGLAIFVHDIFLPYTVGGLLPGVAAGLVGYWLTVPVIRAYQARRRSKLKAKLAALRAKAAPRVGAAGKGVASKVSQAQTPPAKPDPDAG
ncbi:DUF2062 domain-containing protein [Pseudooceanicola sp. CBS1P-1]|uniref:DUF2062 domain-containing protein n=1 Tax=Pseudooceanicola albus TaxID=2692189 RepID=A0A6L7FXH9_9RHOB|nr:MULTISPECIES: DUF2062 domain-containing protein [Pseudooceanicola]MBT9384047.1 DUF2062 domain-containing protein [Pseudooceanicola endophyticus]MXN16541.1 DUF2062 domain-containing protein [Pseudooceanicola albus]